MSKHGASKRDIVPNINFFMNVPISPSSEMTIVDGLSKPATIVELVAEMDVLCVISELPRSAFCNRFNPTPIQVLVWEVGSNT